MRKTSSAGRLLNAADVTVTLWTSTALVPISPHRLTGFVQTTTTEQLRKPSSESSTLPCSRWICIRAQKSEAPQKSEREHSFKREAVGV
eukprot:5574450-Pleurochrysis_carterae.AAC.2